MLHPIAAEIIEMIEAIEAADLSPEDLAATTRAIAEKIAANPDVATQLPPGLVDSLMSTSDQMDQNSADAKKAERRLAIAEQNVRITQAEFNHLADELLDNQDDEKKGN